MDDLIKLVSEKAGITEKQAQEAVATVLDFLKAKLPPSIGDQLDAVAQGEGLSSSAGDLLKGAGGLFGKK